MSESEPETAYAVLHDLGLDVDDLNPLDRDFLKAVGEHSDATTSKIRETAAIERQKIHYRYEKFEELGLIDVDRVGVECADGRRSNVATLTEDGRRLVESGALDELEGVNLTVSKIMAHFDYLQSYYDQRLDRERRERETVERQLEELREELGALEGAYDYFKDATVPQKFQERDERLSALEERVAELETDE